MKDIIYKRKSTRKYLNKEIEEDLLKEIQEYINTIKPLYKDIKYKFELVKKENVKSMFSWMPPQVYALYSEEKEGYLENIGFIGQQLDLFLQKKGLGACWIGLGKLDIKVDKSESNGLKYQIMIAFGYPSETLYREVNEFKRKELKDIVNYVDSRLEVARLAPSSVNSQPWYFVVDNELIHVFCNKGGFIKGIFLGDLNMIDVGISLAHLYIANIDTFTFTKLDNITYKKYAYIGTIKI